MGGDLTATSPAVVSALPSTEELGPKLVVVVVVVIGGSGSSSSIYVYVYIRIERSRATAQRMFQA